MSKDEHDDEHGIEKPVDDDYIDVGDRPRADVRVRQTHERRRAKGQPVVRRDESDLTHAIDSSAGSGASAQTDEYIDRESVSNHGAGAKTRTGWSLHDVDGDKDKWQRLLRLNEDGRHPDRRTINRAEDRRRMVETLCSHLGVARDERVKYIIGEVDMSHMAHYSSPQVILGAISIVCERDDRFIRDEDQFQELMDEQDIGPRGLRNVRDLLFDKADSLP